MIICDTKMAKGVPFLETREKAHFIRVEADEWQKAIDLLDTGFALRTGRRKHETFEVHPAQARCGAGRRRRRGQPRLTTSAMIASIAGEGQRTKSAPFGHALAALAEQRPDIVGMTADLGKYTDLHIFARQHPERFYQMGMAEQLLLAAAAGMARVGFVPFATTYAVFATRRAYDFMHQAISEEGLPVKIVVALPGLSTGYGPSHQAAEDLALMRQCPE